MNKSTLRNRTAAVAFAVFGFAASLTAFAAGDPALCERCRTDVLEPCLANTPDDKCFVKYRQCLRAYGCQLEPI
ncbi:hypothetical protein [Lysobacter sp. CA199]|uniref:hypothetical protein n=1 Tax=Lysobacter sp. CA199 TaxID=3455608 RepID=UPI003F8D152A